MRKGSFLLTIFMALVMLMSVDVMAQRNRKKKSLKGSKPNIIMIVSDDTGWGDFTSYGGGIGRGIKTPSMDRLDKEGMQFWDFYGQPSCTPGRAAMQTGRIPNRSGMTTVAFQGQGGGLPAAEWTVAEVLKKAGYQTFFSGKWHLGESDYALPNAQGYDIMKNVVLYHLNAYTYTMPSFHPGMSADQLAFFEKATTGILEGNADEPAKEVTKVTRENIGELDMMMMDNVLPQIETYAKSKKPFFMSINFAKNHQPNVPSKQFAGSSPAKTKYADAVQEMDYNVGRILDKIKEMGIEENTLIVYTVDNGSWQDVYPDCGYTPFRGTKGTDREAGSRVPAYAMWKGVIEPGTESFDICGGLDFMATFASLAGIDLPKVDQEGKPTIFDSYDMTPILTGHNKDFKREAWYYFTERELAPGAIRVGRWKFVFNMRGDNGAVPGSDGPAPLLGWTGPEMYVATVPQVYDLWQDPQERYDVFMNSFTESTWTTPMMTMHLEEILNTYVKYPPRPVQSEGYSGSLSITRFRELMKINKEMKEKGFDLKITSH
ncbi:arylsulfatase [Halosquirtibacter laminarini]|uniref:Arylsulfatase n=1 Tax=Halosquirtibacter laminarini TaxID=3374600 RepID=A0AC61NJ05_9BACT|nr:arylsulfatase [Prolixibacteraceae bacterium]